METSTRKLTERAAAWYLDYRDGLDEAGLAALARWLQSAPEHLREFQAIARLHGDVVAAARAHTAPAEQLAHETRSQGNVLRLPRRGRAAAPPHRRRARPLLAAACAALALLMLAWPRWQAPAHGQRYVADIHAVRRLALQDGTWVQLDRGSVLEVRFDGRRRLVELLRGQALFDIGHGDARPFVVRAGDTLVRDVGTVFDVDRSQAGLAVTVVQGRAQLWQRPRSALQRWRGRDLEELPSARPLADLLAGEQSRFGDDGRMRYYGPADLGQATAWLPADIRFENASVAEVARRFNAYTSLPLAIEDARVAAMRPPSWPI